MINIAYIFTQKRCVKNADFYLIYFKNSLSRFDQFISLNFAHLVLHMYSFTVSDHQIKQKEHRNRLFTLDF